MAFDYLSLKTGDGVDVSTEADFSNPVAGVITKVESDCCFIDVCGSGQAPLEFCRHRSEVDLPGGAERFAQEQALLTDNGQIPPRVGVFEKSRSQALIEDIPVKVAALERVVNELLVQVGELRQSKAESEPDEPPKQAHRPRGRPPNKKPEPEVTSDAQVGEPMGAS